MRAWLGPKRRFYLAWLAACFVVALVVPVAMHVAAAHFPAGTGWEATSFFIEVRAITGVSWRVSAWLFPLAYPAVLTLAIVLLESLVYALRFDRGDRAWSAMRWSLGGWRPLLAWLLVPALLVALASLLIEPLAPLVFYGSYAAPYLVPILLPFFVTKPDYLSAKRPALASRPRWSGALPFLLVLIVPVGVPVVATACAQWFGAKDVSAVLVSVVVLAALVVPLIAQMAWLNPKEGGAEAARRALQPRVLLPAFVLFFRIEILEPMLLLVGLPVAIFFYLMAQLEPQLVRLGTLGLEPFIHASRFGVSWWWAASLGWSALVRLCVAWLTITGQGRLLLELGQVRKDAG